MLLPTRLVYLRPRDTEPPPELPLLVLIPDELLLTLPPRDTDGELLPVVARELLREKELPRLYVDELPALERELELMPRLGVVTVRFSERVAGT